MDNYKKIIGSIILLTLFIFMKTDYNIAFSATSNVETDTSTSETTPTPPKDGNVILDGVIGEWDLQDEDGVSKKLQALGDNEVEGNKPNSGDYFTISVTVPVNMEFGVYSSSSNVVMGSFYSPKYKVKNNGSKTLNIKAGLNTTEEEKRENTLYIAKPTVGNGKVEMDLDLSYANGEQKKVVDLTGDTSDANNRREVGTIKANEEAEVTFVSEDWEPISWEPTVKESVNFSGSLTFEFSY